MQIAHAVTYTLVALVLLTSVGNVACRLMFKWGKLKGDDSTDDTKVRPAGWIIGWLERMVLAIGILTQSWEVLAAVIALKTVARFKELDDQSFAEIFLVGSLFSILWAVFVTSVWLAYDRHFGVDLQTQFVGIYETQGATPKDCTEMASSSHAFHHGQHCGYTALCPANSDTCLAPTAGVDAESKQQPTQ